MAEINNEFFKKILNRSVEIGHVKLPHRSYHGHAVRHYPSGGDCSFCFWSCGRNDDKLAVVITAITCVFFAFVAFAYALQSADIVREAKHDLARLEESETQVVQGRPVPSAPPENFSSHLGVPQQPLNPYHDHVSPRVEDNGCKEAKIVLEGQRKERTWIAISQGTMCVGATLLTAVLLTTIAVQGPFIYPDLWFGGMALLAGGAIFYGWAKYFRNNAEEQIAAALLRNSLECSFSNA